MQSKLLPKLLLGVSFAFMSISFAGAQDKGAPVEEDNVRKSASYIIGFDIGSNAKAQGLDLEAEQVIAGLADALAGKKSKFSDEEVATIMRTFQTRLREKMAAKAKEEGEANLREGEEFLKKNATAEGVKTLESGLQYKVVRAVADAASPTEKDTVRVHYKGTFLDGKTFDSSYDRNEPAEFPVGGVIRGWVEGLQRMKVGEKWILYVPSNLAYGPQGAPPDIGPNKVLVFEVELLDILK